MNRFYAHTAAGEPAVRLDDRDPATSRVLVDACRDWYFTSKDQHRHRRIATSCTQATELAKAFERIDHGTSGRTGSAARGGPTTLRGIVRLARRQEAGPS